MIISGNTIDYNGLLNQDRQDTKPFLALIPVQSIFPTICTVLLVYKQYTTKHFILAVFQKYFIFSFSNIKQILLRLGHWSIYYWQLFHKFYFIFLITIPSEVDKQKNIFLKLFSFQQPDTAPTMQTSDYFVKCIDYLFTLL